MVITSGTVRPDQGAGHAVFGPLVLSSRHLEAG
jgi:hypothetical protein